MSRSIEGNVDISSASKVEPGPTPKPLKSKAWAVTTISSTPDEPSVNDKFASLPNLVKILFFIEVCPDLVTVILNGPPNLKPLEKNAPELPVDVDDLLPDGEWIIWTDAPETGFPDSSITEPLITPVVCSANRSEIFIDEIKIAKIAKAMIFISLFV